MKTILVDVPYSNPSVDLAKHIESCKNQIEALKEFSSQLEDATLCIRELAECLNSLEDFDELEDADLKIRTDNGKITILMSDDVAEELGEEICEELEFCEFE